MQSQLKVKLSRKLRRGCKVLEHSLWSKIDGLKIWSWKSLFQKTLICLWTYFFTKLNYFPWCKIFLFLDDHFNRNLVLSGSNSYIMMETLTVGRLLEAIQVLILFVIGVVSFISGLIEILTLYWIPFLIIVNSADYLILTHQRNFIHVYRGIQVKNNCFFRWNKVIPLYYYSGITCYNELVMLFHGIDIWF